MFYLSLQPDTPFGMYFLRKKHTYWYLISYFMFQTLTFYHNTMRWVVLLSLVISIYRAVKGYVYHKEFSSLDNGFRHWTATIAHIQLTIGMILYFKSPLVQYFLAEVSSGWQNFQLLFFGVIHSVSMLIAIVVITVGSALAKRKEGDRDKHRTVMIWYSVALVILFMAIPWPFSPLAIRPYFR